MNMRKSNRLLMTFLVLTALGYGQSVESWNEKIGRTGGWALEDKSPYCLVIDGFSLKPWPTYEKMLAYEVRGHNRCSYTSRAFTTSAAFYDKDDFRLGFDSFDTERLAPGEKFRHTFIVPGTVTESGVPVAIRVKETRVRSR